MKNVIITCLLLAAAGCCLPQVITILPERDYILNNRSVTSGLENSFPPAFWLDDVSKYIDRSDTNDISPYLVPGYFKYDIEAYSVDPGYYLPVEQSGCITSPMTGKKNVLVKNILTRSVEHPEITHEDVQLLLWGIEAGMKFSHFHSDFQTRIQGLITTEDIGMMGSDFEKFDLRLLPPDVKMILDIHKLIRDKLAAPDINYSDIEKLAVKTGRPRDGFASRFVPLNSWSLMSNGAYVRIVPKGITSATVEVYKPPAVLVDKDSKKRFTSFVSGKYRIDITYEDSAAAGLLKLNKDRYRINRIKSLRFSCSSPEAEQIINDRGWYIPLSPELSKKEEAAIDKKKNFSRAGDPTSKEYMNRNKAVNGLLDRVEKLAEHLATGKKNKYIDLTRLSELEQFRLALESISPDPSAGDRWLKECMNITRHAVNNCISEIITSVMNAKSGDVDRNTLDIITIVCVPGNTSYHRLALSPRLVKK